MMNGSERVTQRLAELTHAFDASFAAPMAKRDEERRGALYICARRRQLAVRVDELAGVEPCGRIVRTPNRPRGLLGLTGVRGQLVATYDLAALLGEPAHTDQGALDAPLHWMLLCLGNPEISLAVEQVEGYVRFSDADLRREDGDKAGEHVKEALMQDGVLHGIVSVSALMATIARRARSAPDSHNEES
jgi:chemotaxis signal transduction protein